MIPCIHRITSRPFGPARHLLLAQRVSTSLQHIRQWGHEFSIDIVGYDISEYCWNVMVVSTWPKTPAVVAMINNVLIVLPMETITAAFTYCGGNRSSHGCHIYFTRVLPDMWGGQAMVVCHCAILPGSSRHIWANIWGSIRILMITQ